MASLGATLLGVAPHVLHHAGPLAGAALFAGAGGTLLFGAVGLAAAVPLLLKMRRRTGTWRRAAAALALFTALFALSSLVVAPVLTGGGDDDNRSSPATGPANADGEHEEHHP